MEGFFVSSLMPRCAIRATLGAMTPVAFLFKEPGSRPASLLVRFFEFALVLVLELGAAVESPDCLVVVLAAFFVRPSYKPQKGVDMAFIEEFSAETGTR